MTEGDTHVVRERAIDRAGELVDSYREAGWDALAVQPANIVPIPVGPDTGEPRPEGGDVGFSFLLPPAEFSLLETLLAGTPETEVVRGGAGDRTALVVTVRDEAAGGAVVIPLWFQETTAGAMARAARERGELDLMVQPPDADRRLNVSLGTSEVFGDPA